MGGRRRSGFPAPTRTSEMRRELSRMTPRTRKMTSTAYRRHDVDRRRRVLLRCRQHAESRAAPSRPRPRTFLSYDNQTQPSTQPPVASRRSTASRFTPRGPLLQPFRRPCSSGGTPIRTFLQVLPYLTLPSGWAGCYTCPALRPYQFGPCLLYTSPSPRD